jgi:hypothetical protein
MPRFTPTLAVSLAALVLAASGGAYATVSTSSRTINACASHKGGGLYVGRHCARRDTRVSWNTVGPIGATGAQGPQGRPGPQGVRGAQGVAGPTASAFVSTDVPVPTVSNGYVPVVSLSSQSDDSHTRSTGKLTADFPARIIVEANTTFATARSSIHGGQCYVGLTNAAGDQTVQGTVGETVFFNQTPGDTVVHVTGAIDEPAGTYDATLYCVGDTSEAYRSDLIAFATAR